MATYNQCMCSIADAACSFTILSSEEEYDDWVDRWNYYFNAVLGDTPFAVIVRCGVSRWGDYYEDALA